METKQAHDVVHVYMYVAHSRTYTTAMPVVAARLPQSSRYVCICRAHTSLGESTDVYPSLLVCVYMYRMVGPTPRQYP